MERLRLRHVRAWAPIALLAILLASILLPAHAWAQTVDEIPFDDPDAGDYSIGFYANRDGSGNEIRLGKDDTTFSLYIGLVGDPVQNFSGAAFRVQLPDFLELAEAVNWTPIPGLQESELVFGEGGQILFLECGAQDGDAPFILARVEIEADLRFREATLAPEAHRRYGLGVQLCNADGIWPKRNAKAVSLRVVRSVSFWDRVASWFD